MASTTTMSHSSKLIRMESVRGAAALYVCMGHILLGSQTQSPLNFVFKFGQEAVMVFFILSGFVIHWATQRTAQPDNFPRYFLKRFLRIYVVWCLANLLIAATSSIEMGRLQLPPVGEFFGNFFMLQDFSSGKPAVICDPLYDNIPLWSLHYEWWFYMAYPLVMKIKSQSARTHCVGAMAIFGAVTYALVPNPLSRLLMYFSVWWIGACAAHHLASFHKVHLRDLAAPLIYSGAASLPLLLLCFNFINAGKHPVIGVHPFLEPRHLLSAVFLVVAAFGWRSLKWIGFRRTVGWCSVLAPISFSMYAVHYKSIAHASYLKNLSNKPLELLLYGFVTLVFCYIAEIVIYPRLRRRILG